MLTPPEQRRTARAHLLCLPLKLLRRLLPLLLGGLSCCSGLFFLPLLLGRRLGGLLRRHLRCNRGLLLCFHTRCLLLGRFGCCCRRLLCGERYECSECPVGKWVVEETQECEGCPTFQYTPAAGTHSCSSCFTAALGFGQPDQCVVAAILCVGGILLLLTLGFMLRARRGKGDYSQRLHAKKRISEYDADTGEYEEGQSTDDESDDHFEIEHEPATTTEHKEADVSGVELELTEVARAVEVEDKSLIAPANLPGV